MTVLERGPVPPAREGAVSGPSGEVRGIDMEAYKRELREGR